MTVMSTPDCSRCVAVACRTVCGEMARSRSDGHRNEAFAIVTRRRCSTPERDMDLPARLGNTGASGRWSMCWNQVRNCATVLLQRGMTRSLRPFPCKCTAWARSEEDVGDTQADHLGDARPGVVQHRKHRGVALSAPCGPIGCVEQSLNLFAGEKAQERADRSACRE